jgi:hypothetical protein
LVLVTDYPGRLLPTVLSRVQKINFFPEKKAYLENKKLLEELGELKKADVAKRFQYVEKISKSPAIKDILTVWLYYFREELITKPNPTIANILLKIQNTIFLLSQTNVNTRLALENLLLDF